MASDYNPDDHTVQEVNDYLADNPDQRDAVLAAERDGQNRKGIVGDDGSTGDDSAPASVQNDANVGTGNPELGTAIGVADGVSLRDAQAKALTGDAETTVNDPAQAYEVGYFGTSPQREATGLEDKGLSQQTPQVMAPTADKA